MMHRVCLLLLAASLLSGRRHADKETEKWEHPIIAHKSQIKRETQKSLYPLPNVTPVTVIQSTASIHDAQSPVKLSREDFFGSLATRGMPFILSQAFGLCID